MKKTTLFFLAYAAIGFAMFIPSCTETAQEASESPTPYSPNPEDIVKHGEYLVTIMGCNDCHSPKAMGPNGPEVIPELMLSGYPSDRPVVSFDNPMLKEGFAMFYPDLTASAGPWGVSFAGNLTPHATGIGTWTEEQFKKAITQGKFKGLDEGRMLLPPMPWFNFKHLKDDDVHAIFMYLQSIPPIDNAVPEAVSPDKMM